MDATNSQTAAAFAPTGLRALAAGRAKSLKEIELRAIMARAEADGAGDVDVLARRISTLARPAILSFVNAHGFNLAANDDEFRRRLLTADFLLRDGVGMKIGMALHGHAPGANLNGTDLIPEILRRTRGRTAVFGTRRPWLSLGADRITAMGCDVASVMDGFQDVSAYVEAARRSRPETIVLAMGMPKQETVAEALRAALDFPCLIINGGAIVDFLAGRVRRAPAPVRRAGMEWAWRLALEPQRLAKRYLHGNPRFLAHVAKLRVSR